MRRLLKVVSFAICFGVICPLSGCGDDDSGAACGNGVIDPGESCDGSDLGGETCGSQGFDAGDLACDPDTCQFDTSGCTGECGDGVINDDEECDDGANGDPCDGCLDDCTAHTNSCGDGYICGSEVCDGSNLADDTCASQGFETGSLACQAECTGFDTSGCSIDPSPVTWISIPGGSFDMGSTAGLSDETPVHAVSVPSFEMTQTEVTVAQYGECVTTGACTEPATGYTDCNWNDPGYENHPVNCVDWNQARNFCAWAGGRLSTEAEWEYAARSGGQDITYPWGDQSATCTYAVMNDGGAGCGTGRTMEVCSKPAGNTAQGLCDMAGNGYEWVEDDWHDDYNGAPNDGSAWVDAPRNSSRVARGGSFASRAVRAANRSTVAPSHFFTLLGFRCAR
jgi:formylglycine-generating enzyme required for sulfatase activity